MVEVNKLTNNQLVANIDTTYKNINDSCKETCDITNLAKHILGPLAEAPPSTYLKERTCTPSSSNELLGRIDFFDRVYTRHLGHELPHIVQQH